MSLLLADQILGRNGYDAQMTDEPAPLNRHNNQWEPLPGDHGAHGRFDAQARKRSWQLELTFIAARPLRQGLEWQPRFLRSFRARKSGKKEWFQAAGAARNRLISRHSSLWRDLSRARSQRHLLRLVS